MVPATCRRVVSPDGPSLGTVPLPVRIGFRTSPQNTDWASLDAAWVEAGKHDVFDSGWLNDHLTDPGLERGGESFESMTTLAALAHLVPGKRVGQTVLAATFRQPSILAKEAITLDHLTGGRYVLCLGAGWHVDEHESFGIDLPPVGERFDRLEEQLAVITGLWETPVGERFSFDGKHYQLTDSPALPKPEQDAVPIVIGGKGRKRTPELVARYGSEFNLPFVSVEESAEKFENVRAVAREHDRDPATITMSNALVLCAGATWDELTRRSEAIGRDLAELRENGLAGSPAEIVDTIGRYAEAGSQRIYLQVLDLSDLDHLDLVASEVIPQLG